MSRPAAAGAQLDFARIPTIQRKCASCEEEDKLAGPVQRSSDGSGLAVGPADDGHEREADRVASAVVAGADTRVEGRVHAGAAQREAVVAARDLTAPSIVGEVVRSPGMPLPAGTRAFMEARIGHDFGGVRVHADARSDASARSVHALAYTVGRDIVFRNGYYDPSSPGGQRLLAHELAHVCQQGAAAGLAQRPGSPAGDRRTPAPLAPVLGTPRVQRQLAPTGGTVTGVRISCADSRVIFDTASGGHAYRMTACDIPVGDYSVGVSTKGTQVDFDFGQSAAKGQRFHFGFTVEPGQVNPATLFQGQHQVAVSVVESLPPARVAPGAAPATLVERVAAFQRLVKNAGKVRLAQNSRALEQWRQFLEKQISPAQVASQLHAEEVRSLLQTAGQGGQAELALADQWLRNRGPNRRWVQQQQIEGRYRACTGCHAAVQADAMDRDLVERGAPLQTPLEQLATAEASPRPDFAEGKRVDVAGQPGASAAVGQAQQRVNAIQPYLQQLGPSGYRVLPAETLGSTAPPSALVADISRRISQRQADYREFSRRIDAPDFDYLLLRPIVRDLLPLADADVRKAVQDAIDRAQTWEIVEKILVGIAAIGTLLLIVFPPTTGLGIAAAWALGTALSAHQVYRGLESYQQGRLLSLGRGADDVLDPAQQEAADAMMAMGALNMVLGTVGLAGSALGAVRILRSLPTGGGVGAMEAVEAEAGGQVYRVSGWGKPNPQVKVTAGNKVVYEGPVSSMPRGSGGAAQATAGATGRSGGYVFPTEGGAARVAEPMPVPVVPPQPAPVVAPTPKIPPPPDLRLPLGMSGGARGVGAVASATTDPSGEPVMPPGLSRAKKELWRACAERYKAYDATKADVAEAVANRRDLHMKVHAKKATPEEKIAYCALLQQQLEVVERLEAQRKAYMDMDCDQFDWFNRGTTPAQRLAAHRGEKNNVSASRGNLMALIHEFCP